MKKVTLLLCVLTLSVSTFSQDELTSVRPTTDEVYSKFNAAIEMFNNRTSSGIPTLSLRLSMTYDELGAELSWRINSIFDQYAVEDGFEPQKNEGVRYGRSRLGEYNLAINYIIARELLTNLKSEL